MKLYNKIIGVFFALCSTLCFSTEQHERYQVKILKLPYVSEKARFSDKPEVHMLCCDGLPDFRHYPIEEFKSFSEEVSLGRRAIFDSAFGSDKEIRLITTDSIVSYMQRKEPERFEAFIRTHGFVEDLLKNAEMISKAFTRTSKIYVKEKELEYTVKEPAVFPEECLETHIDELFDPKHYYEKFEIMNPADYCEALNEIVDLTSKTEFGRKTLTIFLLCHYCLGHPIFGKNLDLMIGVGSFESDYPFISIDFDEISLEEYKGCKFLVFNIETYKVEYVENLYTYSEMFCHELNHAIHLILGSINYSEVPLEQYLEYPFLRELMSSCFEEIKTKLKETLFERIKTRKDLIDTFCDNFRVYEISNELKKKDILENKDLVCQLIYRDLIKRNYDFLEENRASGYRTYYNTMEKLLIDNILRHRSDLSKNELLAKGLGELESIVKETILKWIQTQEGLNDILSWHYRDCYHKYYPSMCKFLASLGEKVLKEKDSVCELLFDDIINRLINIAFSDFEEINNILGVEMIESILFINEFSDIYQLLSKGVIFRFAHVGYSDSINGMLTLNSPSERCIDALLQLHGFQ